MRSIIAFDGNPGVSSRTLTSDVVVTMTRVANAIGALVTVETNDIRFDFGQDPDQTNVGHVLVAGAGLKINSGIGVASFRFINKTNGSQAAVTITQYTEN